MLKRVKGLKRSYKIALAVGLGLVVILGVTAAVQRQKAGVVAVQTGKVARQDLASVVTASGEVRPRNFVNIGSQSFGKIVSIHVAEGDRVRRGQVLLRMEAVQPAAEMEGQQAFVHSSEAAATATEAGLKTAQAELQRSRADYQRASLEWERAQGLRNEQLISKSEFDARQAGYESARAAVELAQARIEQSRAELARSRSTVEQARASLVGAKDRMQKTIYTSPIDGVITNLPVHVGEQMVTGFQNNPGSFLMTVADMSKVTAEVKVDETDIPNIKMGQPAEITIDAFPNKTFKGAVTEVGSTALVRSTGQSTVQLQGGTQEAKDFKVVITLSEPPETIRPGLSTTAKITTATRAKALAIPIQALTIRRRSQIEEAERQEKGESAQAAEVANPGNNPAAKEEWTGVFVVENGKAVFKKVETGITGTTDIEVTSGLAESQEIITGSYRALRELKHLARIRVEKPGEGGPPEAK